MAFLCDCISMQSSLKQTDMETVIGVLHSLMVSHHPLCFSSFHPRLLLLFFPSPFSCDFYLQVPVRKSPDSSFRSEKVLKKGYDKVGRVNQTFYVSTLSRTSVFVSVK